MPNHIEHSIAETRTHPGRSLTAVKRIRASWQRSAQYGVSTEEPSPAWAGSVNQDTLFFHCGQKVLAGLRSTLANEPISVMLTDGEGLVLDRQSEDTSLLRELDKVYLAPGFGYSEKNAGTNGLGLALADRVPTLVRAEEHYSARLQTYTCAAAPVLDPLTGQLEGSINITTWSRSSPALLLALAQSAAGNATALMLARGQGRTEQPERKGGLFRLQRRFEDGWEALPSLSPAWTQALEHAQRSLSLGRIVAAVGEKGAGRATLLGQAIRQTSPRNRILCATAPSPDYVEAWMALWMPEMAKPDTTVIVENVDLLPQWVMPALQEGARKFQKSGPLVDGIAPAAPFAVTASDLASIPQPLAAMVDTVIPISPLRDRPDDVLPLAMHAARQSRLREVEISPSAECMLTDHDWPGNIDELFRIIEAAAARTETIEARHLPPALAGRPGPRLTRIEAMERSEIVRCLSQPGITIAKAAGELGLSRATMYRRMARFGISGPIRDRRP